MSQYSSSQKLFLWTFGGMVGLLILLPATYGVYSVCERSGGLIPSLLYWLTIFGTSGTLLFLFSGGSWPNEINGRKPQLLEGTLHFLKTALLQFAAIITLGWSLIILGYGWKLLGVAPL